MHFRYILLGLGIASLSISAHAATASQTNYTVGTIASGGLMWQKPDAIKRSPNDAAAFCAASTNGGLTGWTVPNRTDLSNMYFDLGSNLLTDLGWALDVMQTSSQALDGTNVTFNFANGSNAAGNAVGLTTCVHTPGPTTFITNRNLTFLRPDGALRNFPNTQAMCASSTAGGLTGWRLPSTDELLAIYHDNNGVIPNWPTTSYVWSNNPSASFHELLRFSDGARAADVWSATYHSTCVHDRDAISVPTFNSGGLRWSISDATLRNATTATNFCASSSMGGVTGWRLPTQQELTDVVYTKGRTDILAAGWQAAYTWTSSTDHGARVAVNVYDGNLIGYTSESAYTVCVRPAAPAESFATINNGNLTWAKPFARTRPVENSVNHCEGMVLGGKGNWRMPTDAEVQALYLPPNNSSLPQAGFPASAGSLWSVELADASSTLSNVEGNGARLYLSCVNETATLANDKFTVNGFQWDKPGVARPLQNAVNYCGDKVVAGQTGWRMPSRSELQALYTYEGATTLQQNGWPADYAWAYNVVGSNFAVVNMANGTATSVSGAVSNRYVEACVRDPNGNPAGTIKYGSLTFARPDAIQRPVANMVNYCANATIAGQTGWRSPTLIEISNMYNATTRATLLDQGWPMALIWSGTPVGGNFYAVNFNDATTISASGADSNRFYVSCVR